jgi:5-methylthioadenosine/S-adenosylhomocysteine deaminase
MSSGGARVLSQDPKVGNFDKGDILVEGARIAAVGADLGPLDAEVIDGTDRIALPGFVDTHRHSWQSLIRHVSTDWTLSQYFSGVRGVLGKEYQPEDMYAANLIAMLDALDSGITTLVDWLHNNNTPEHADAALQAVLDAGSVLSGLTATRTTSGYRSARSLSPGTWSGSLISGSPPRIRR